jgi:predicted ATPase
MEGKRLLHSLDIKNLLSFGSEGVSLELGPLNVLIGPNASGKSNLIETISLLAAAPRDLLVPIREGGGVLEWLWKDEEKPEAELRVKLSTGKGDLLYWLSFTSVRSRFHLIGERLEHGDGKVLYSWGENSDRPFVRITNTSLSVDVVTDRNQSILAQLKDPVRYYEITETGRQFAQIRFFRNLNAGPNSALRRPQGTDLPDDFLLEDGSNLGLVLNKLKNHPVTKRVLLDRLKSFYEGIEDFETQVQGGTIQVFMHERGDRTISSARLSDGTLHYLCLLAILCHPEPPPLICIEEPELGLHPDILPTVGDLLLEAAQRTQLIVTTHSETLVSRLSEFPETVITCERDDGGTKFQRLDRPKLEEWLERYTLGELWRMGEIGGNRW